MTTIGHDLISIGSPALVIQGRFPYVIEGNYSALLEGSGISPFTGQAADFPVSISQSGLVPGGSLSIELKIGNQGRLENGMILPGMFRLTLDDQPVSMLPVDKTSVYTMYRGDVSSFAGTFRQLTITAPVFNAPALNHVFLDSMVFSSTPVPEPGTWALFGLGSALLCCATRRRKK